MGAVRPLAWPAPAKVNLFLHVNGRRPDGYHELQTLFQFIDFCDLLEFRSRSDGVVRRGGGWAGVPETDDLAIRAARLLKAHAPAGAGVEIRVRKQVPAGAGLGGGSSDAATVLVALNRLWDLRLDTAGLAELGLELGADVPVFVRGRAAWGEGVGERLWEVALDEPWYLVLSPACHVSTARIFTDPTLTRNTPRLKMSDFLEAGASGVPACTVRTLVETTSNDCEPVTRALHPEVDAAIRWLEQAGPARMTGTGAAVFAVFDDRREAEAWRARLPRGLTGFVARGVNRSPLLARASAS
jgi:4-diphosphocytidyl-2-C-methyl-D-erythritol kinase